MRILVLTTSFPAYKGHHRSIFIFRFAQSLANKGINIDLICPFYKNSENKDEILDAINIHRFQSFFPLFLQKIGEGEEIYSNLKKSLLCKIQFPFFLLFMFLRSIKYIKKCDIIHAQWSLSGLIGVFLKKLYKKKLILTTRGTSFNLSMKNFF